MFRGNFAPSPPLPFPELKVQERDMSNDMRNQVAAVTGARPDIGEDRKVAI